MSQTWYETYGAIIHHIQYPVAILVPGPSSIEKKKKNGTSSSDKTLANIFDSPDAINFANFSASLFKIKNLVLERLENVLFFQILESSNEGSRP